MYPIGHPAIATRIAEQVIDDRIRNAKARRIARAVRREARIARDRSDGATTLTAQGLSRPAASHPTGATP